MCHCGSGVSRLMPNEHDFVIPEEDRPFVSMALVTYAASLRRACNEFIGVPEAGVALSQAAKRAESMAQAINPAVRDYSMVPGMGIITSLAYPRSESTSGIAQVHTRQSCSNTTHPKCPQCGKNPTNRDEEESILKGQWVCLKCGYVMRVYQVIRYVTEPIDGWGSDLRSSS